MFRKRICLTIGLAAALAALGGCGATVVPPPPTPDVTVASPEQRDVTIYRILTGNVDAMESVVIRARVQGFLQEKNFEDGSVVSAGQQLFLIEPGPYEREVERLTAEVDAFKVELQQAQFDLGKTEQLAEEQAANEKQLNDARLAVARADANLAAAEASLSKAALNLTYTQVITPIKGRVSRGLVDVGNLVGAGTNTELTMVNLMAPVYVYFEVDESTIVAALGERPVNERFQPSEGMHPFAVSLPGQTEFSQAGNLDFVDNQVDAETGTIRVRGILPNDEGLLIPGQFVRVRVPVSRQADALLVHEQAIGSDLGGKYLLVVNDESVVEHHPVQLGQLEGDMRIILDGIESGDRYVVEGLQRARPGRPVVVSGEMSSGPATDEGESGE